LAAGLLAARAADADRRASIVFRLFLLLIPLVVLLPAQALAQGEVKGRYGDWELRCDTPPGAQNEQCVVMQYVTAEDRENVGLSVVVMKTADKEARILRVLAPLGVLLPKGLGLRIDGADMGTAGFLKCVQNGCFSEVLLDDELIGKLRDGKEAMFIIFTTPEEGIGVPISLNGFGEGYDALP
jgi:invasion protein IalB